MLTRAAGLAARSCTAKAYTAPAGAENWGGAYLKRSLQLLQLQVTPLAEVELEMELHVRWGQQGARI